jgi:hypothetical protein
VHIYYSFRYTKSEEKRMSGLLLIFIRFDHFDLLCIRVGAGAGVESKFRPEPEPHKNDVAPQQ